MDTCCSPKGTRADARVMTHAVHSRDGKLKQIWQDVPGSDTTTGCLDGNIFIRPSLLLSTEQFCPRLSASPPVGDIAEGEQTIVSSSVCVCVCDRGVGQVFVAWQMVR